MKYKHQGGDAARALSAVRNLFAGVLLLFEYKIASSVDNSEEAGTLIFSPHEVQPFPDGCGGIKWKPVGKFKRTTIDVAAIKKRFDAFGIEVDWMTINKLQACRNHLEHLHPANTLGEVAGFVADLFPLIRDFVEYNWERRRQICWALPGQLCSNITGSLPRRARDVNRRKPNQAYPVRWADTWARPNAKDGVLAGSTAS